MNIAIILASGQGKRMGAGKNKVLLRLDNKPLIFHTLTAYQKSPEIDKIIVTGREEEIPLLRAIVKKYSLDKVTDFVIGGIERQDSGYNALVYLRGKISEPKKTFVLFHNGANPFVTLTEISATLESAKKHGACAVAHPTKDTIKEVAENGLVVKTLDRSRLKNMQTPQTIRFDLAWSAFDSAIKAGYVGTDDVSLVERIGKKVKVIEGSLNNFKITTPLDLALAKIILRNNEE